MQEGPAPPSHVASSVPPSFIPTKADDKNASGLMMTGEGGGNVLSDSFKNISYMISGGDVVRRYAKYIFLDVVGFSKRSAEAQSQIVKALNSIVHAALRQCQVDDQDRILIPTGDGMCIALVNIQLPYDIHIQTALQILKLLSEHNQSTPDASRQFEVRIGINQNTDILVQDVNDRPNIAGAGIN